MVDDTAETKIRLQKVLALAGLGSRRACEALIDEGRVEVDGKRVTQEDLGNNFLVTAEALGQWGAQCVTGEAGGRAGRGAGRRKGQAQVGRRGAPQLLRTRSSVPPISGTGTATLELTITASGTVAPPAITGEATALVGVTLTGSGTHTPPQITGDATALVGVTVTATGTAAPPAIDGTALAAVQWAFQTCVSSVVLRLSTKL